MAPARVLVGTGDGLLALPEGARSLSGREVTALALGPGAWWALLDGRTLARSAGADAWDEAASLEGPPGRCVLPSPAGVFVGTAEARLRRVEGDRLAPVPGFDQVPGREEWYTPWGGPPDTRSLSVEAGGLLYANVHVGGIPRSEDGGVSWRPTIDVHADVHQVLADPRGAGRVLAAAAVGIVRSDDAGDTWRQENDGLHATYCRAVAIAGDAVLVSASSGPGGGRSAVYRRAAAGGAWERCRGGLPEWFDGNIDTACLSADGATAAIGTGDGRVFVSGDEGSTWEEWASGLPAVLCVGVAPA